MNDKWVRDTGLITCLLALYLAYRGFGVAFGVAATILAVLLLAPRLLYPLGWGWYMFAQGLGYVTQRLFFGAVFFVVVTPIGVLRRMLVGDSRDLSRDTGRATAFTKGSGPATRERIARPY